MGPGGSGGNRRGIARGPRPLGNLLPAITRPAFRRRAPAGAQLLADWASIVGPALAATTVPRRLTSGTLTVACSGAMALELQHLAPQLIGRINGQMGTQLVQRLRFVQEAPPAPQAAPPAPPPQALEAARQAVSGLEPGPLRDALEALGRRVLARP